MDLVSIAADLNKDSCKNARVFEENGKIVAAGYIDNDEYTAFITDVLGHSFKWERIPEDVQIVFRNFIIAVNDIDGDVKFTKALCKRGKTITFEKCNLVYQCM